MTFHDSVVEWFALGALNLVVAALIGGMKPRRLPNVVAAALVGANGVLGVFFAFSYGLQSTRWPGIAQETWYDPFVIGVNTVSLVAFIAFPFLFPRRVLPARWERALLWGTAALLGLNWLLLLVLRRDWTNGFDDPILRYTAFIPFFVGLSTGSFVLLDTYVSSPSRALRTQAFFILAAYTMKAAAYVPALWAGPLQDVASWASFAIPSRLLVTALLALVVLGVPVTVFSSRLRGTGLAAGPRPVVQDLALLLCSAYVLVLPSGLDRVFGATEYMLLRPILFAYGILQFQLLDVEMRARRTVVSAAILTAMASVFISVAYRGQLAGLSGAVATGLAIIATVGVAGLFLWPLIRALLGPEPAGPDPRGHDLYRAALEEAVAAGKGHDTTNERVLKTLRNRLQISEREHAVMEASARSLFGKASEGPAVGQVFLGRYRIERMLGEGGFGRTYLARDQQVDRLVVLKAARLSSERETRRLMKEARIVGRLRHPNVVTVYDVEEVAGDAILVLEYVEGGSLAQRTGRKRIPVLETLDPVDETLAALEAAHAEGVVHRDVKPENILLTKDGHVKLADFGVARAPAGSGTVTGLSFDGEHPGSLLYMSPEQVRGLALDGRSDLYAVGVVWYEMLAGRTYLDVRGRTEFDVRLAILEEPPRLPIPGVPPGVNDLLARCLAKDPSRRPASARDMRGEIRRATRVTA